MEKFPIFTASGTDAEFIKTIDIDLWILRFKTLLRDLAPRILAVLVFLAASHFIITAVIKLTEKLLKKSKIDATLHNFILSLTKTSIKVLVVIVALLMLNVPTSPLVTVIGSVGLALSLALKDSLANVAGGISVLLNRPFAKGDLIEIKDVVGVVDSIDIVYTRIKTDDEKIVYMPNGDVSKSVVTNYSSEPLKRLNLHFFIPVESDFEKSKEIILNVLNSGSYTLKQPAPCVSINGKNADSYSISCMVWAKAEFIDTISSPLSEEIDLKLRQAGI